MTKNRKIGTILFLLVFYAAQSMSAGTAKNLKCKGCVGTKDLANKAVTSSKIKNGSVNFGKLGPDVQVILDTVDSNDTRITVIEGGTASIDVAVKCSDDANAFINTAITDSTTYTLTGMCNGPIVVFRKRNVIIKGDGDDTEVDGVVLPAGLTSDPYSAIAIWESSAEVRNLRLDATNYVSNNYPWGPGFVYALQVAQQSITRVFDVDLVGGDYSLGAYKNSYVKTYSNVRITAFNISGVHASGSSHIELSDTIQVVGADSTTAKYPEAIGAYYNSYIEIKNGGTFTPPGSGLATENYAIKARHNSTIQAMNSGTSNFNGDVMAAASGVIWFKGGAVLTGHVEAKDLGRVRIDNSSHSGGYIWAGRNGAIRIGGSSTINTTGYYLSGQAGASIDLRGTATVTSDKPINLDSFATLTTSGTPDLGSVGITCQTAGQHVNYQTPTNTGTITNC